MAAVNVLWHFFGVAVFARERRAPFAAPAVVAADNKAFQPRFTAIFHVSFNVIIVKTSRDVLGRRCHSAHHFFFGNVGRGSRSRYRLHALCGVWRTLRLDVNSHLAVKRTLALSRRRIDDLVVVFEHAREYRVGDVVVHLAVGQRGDVDVFAYRLRSPKAYRLREKRDLFHLRRARRDLAEHRLYVRVALTFFLEIRPNFLEQLCADVSHFRPPCPSDGGYSFRRDSRGLPDLSSK